MNNITERSLFLTVTFFVVKKIICKIIIYAKPSCLLHSMRFKISKYKIISLKFTLYCLERLRILNLCIYTFLVIPINPYIKS